VSQLDQITQQNAAMVEQATAASKSLASESAHLDSLLTQFDVKVTASKNSRRPASDREALPLQKAPVAGARKLMGRIAAAFQPT
jgi:methyl-accepting chemotaxis protein